MVKVWEMPELHNILLCIHSAFHHWWKDIFSLFIYEFRALANDPRWRRYLLSYRIRHFDSGRNPRQLKNRFSNWTTLFEKLTFRKDIFSAIFSFYLWIRALVYDPRWRRYLLSYRIRHFDSGRNSRQLKNRFSNWTTLFEKLTFRKDIFSAVF